MNEVHCKGPRRFTRVGFWRHASWGRAVRPRPPVTREKLQLSSRRVDRRARIFEICSQSHTASRGVLSAGMDQGTAGGARHDGWCQSFLVENVSDALSMETRSSMMVFYPIHVICEADSVAALRFIMVHHASGVGIVESGADRLWVKDGCVGADRVNLSHVCFRSICWLDASTRTAHTWTRPWTRRSRRHANILGLQQSRTTRAGIHE